METSPPSPQNDASLRGKIAAVTGAASGIGRAVALQLAGQGASLLLHTRSNDHGLRETANLAQRIAPHIEIKLVQADFVEPSQQDRFCEEAWNWQQRLDILVNNAGVDVLTGAAAELSFEEKLELVYRVDVVATMRLSRTLGAQMRGIPGGSIVNIGWDQAAHGMEGDSGEMFAMSKGAIMAFSKSLARSLAPEVRVNCVAPGWIQTAWGENTSDYWHTRAARESLIGTWGQPADVAATIGFLVSPAARFVNGQTIAVNGGFNHGGQPPRTAKET
ncbi:SDR family NAD(P)-dependent oxidoreductase [Bremerella cremea]|uniref:SDR family NAD(P)-dependent oxidoreductase n=1 Tax=Bremerella cremea TaxID=1031537 RepID=A0A368KTY5_9BACT|nr:SDR family oxidoreductase [Bremerella cremea]RCS53858.1 SDR family NAD(P)-dependent oxidoreductase [Bremerella cremea]